MGFDEKTCNDDARWRQIDEDWYTSGKPYRDIEHAIGGRNTIFHNWLDHPSYDRFWQKFIPYKEQFRHVKIPVLATTGYYASGEVGTLYYFTEHYKYDPHANHTLLIGPYDDGAMQHGAPANLRGYQLDQAALVDLRELRYQWFDHIFKGAEKPAALSDRVNFQVMGSNEWQHAASMEAMGKGSLKFYLDAAPASGWGNPAAVVEEDCRIRRLCRTRSIWRIAAIAACRRPTASSAGRCSCAMRWCL